MIKNIYADSFSQYIWKIMIIKYLLPPLPSMCSKYSSFLLFIIFITSAFSILILFKTTIFEMSLIHDILSIRQTIRP